MVNDQGAAVKLDRVGVAFDDERLVSDAGLLLPATLAGRFGLERLVNETVRLGDGVPGAALPGRKVLSLVHGMLAGADCIDDVDVLRAGSTGLVLGHAVMAPSTLGTFLRAFTFGHVRQLDRVLELSLQRAWVAGAGPGDRRLVVDIDSFIGEVHGYGKQGAGYGYTKKLGYHPLLATRAGSAEVLHIRNRRGQANTQRGQQRFLDELLARVRPGGRDRDDPDPRRQRLREQEAVHAPGRPGRRVLDRRQAAQARARGDRRDPGAAVAAARRLPRHR
jgi:hypothetical protein